MGFELQQLRQAVALAEHGSFVRAAAALHISQPALSRSIQQLERRFGGALFLRGATGVVPTDLGRHYLERARDLLRLADELDRDAVAQGLPSTGRVAVGGGPFPSESFLGPAAARFVEQHPQMSVQLLSRDWDELLRHLRSRELDFFVGEVSTMQLESDLEIQPLPSKHSLHLLARAGHPLAGRERIGAAEALEWPFVVPGRIPPRVLDPFLAVRRSLSRRGVSQRPFPAILCQGLSPVKRILAASDAVSASMLSCVRAELETGALVLLGTEPWLHLSYGLVSLKGRPWTRAAERLRELLLEAERIAADEEIELAERFRPGRAVRRGGRARLRPTPR